MVNFIPSGCNLSQILSLRSVSEIETYFMAASHASKISDSISSLLVVYLGVSLVIRHEALPGIW